MNNMTRQNFQDVVNFITLERGHFQGLVKVAFPEVVDALHIHKAHQCVMRVAERINEPVLLCMGSIEQLYVKDEGWLPAVDYSQQRTLDECALDFAVTMSGASWVEPEYLLDVNIGMHRPLAELRVKELRENGLRMLKGDWMEAETAPSTNYLKPPAP